ncbi:MAG: 1-deoxy-D-xylulose-5-phosphate synthase [Firmicutes bacterium]|nr:1-deoxy-D-xylulose-5-phosphate synthase [[Eubacterium] siraeum]MCM1487381.1 1-deoxy-D-xylulose-5-phosphate synthase [Bacillota bacterium]
MILSSEISPQKIKELSLSEMEQLCSEIRAYIIKTVYKNGGHLASSLGTVELCVALHSVFSTPEDKIIFDVGHQAYAHKIITGRYNDFVGLRCENGISGFPRPDESLHDAFIAGHASTSISAALGIAKAMEIKGESHYVVSVIGDGALTGGEAYEGLNNASKIKGNFIVILNDNEMSISKNQGAVASYLAQMCSSTGYFETKRKVKAVLSKTAIGRELAKSVSGTKELVKFAIFQSNIFENLGYKYLGPIDGNSLAELLDVLNVAKQLQEPCIIHIKTKKGKGYKPAEENSGEYHGVSKLQTSLKGETKDSYSDVMGKYLLELADKDETVCGITAAMKYATGLQFFAKAHKSRFFDVGIAEEHAVTFAGGLASQGMLPVVCIYSTFLQRCYDQILHDLAIEKEHVVFAVDRAGMVGEDGETHQGLFDVSMLSSIPGAEIYSPSNDAELRASLYKAMYICKGIAAVRYPKGASTHVKERAGYDVRHFTNKGKALIITYGRVSNYAYEAAKTVQADVLQLVKIYPIVEKSVEIAENYNKIVFFEEGIRSGGIAEKFSSELMKSGWKGQFIINAVENRFVSYSETDKQLAKFQLDTEGIIKVVGEIIEQT